MHEHINFFTPKSVKTLADRSGMVQVYNKIHFIDYGWSKGYVISAVLRHPDDAAGTRELDLKWQCLQLLVAKISFRLRTFLGL